MKPLQLISISILLFVSCTTNRHPAGLQLATSDTTKAQQPETAKPLQTIIYGNLEDLDSTDYMLIPLGLKTISDEKHSEVLRKSIYENETTEERKYAVESKYNFRILTMTGCNNIIFYNKKTEETHLLLQKPAVISSFYFPSYNYDYKGVKFYFLLFGIRDDDSNGDGFINNNDAEKVFLSDLSGKNMMQLTPENTQLVDWFIDVPTNNILLYVRTDSNADKKFDMKDEVVILKSSITKPAMGKEIINATIKNSITKIFEQIK